MIDCKVEKKSDQNSSRMVWPKPFTLDSKPDNDLPTTFFPAHPALASQVFKHANLTPTSGFYTCSLSLECSLSRSLDRASSLCSGQFDHHLLQGRLLVRCYPPHPPPCHLSIPLTLLICLYSIHHYINMFSSLLIYCFPSAIKLYPPYRKYLISVWWQNEWMNEEYISM